MDKQKHVNILQSLIDKNNGQRFYYDCTEFKIRDKKLYLYSELFYTWQRKKLTDLSHIEILEIIKRLRGKNTYKFKVDSIYHQAKF